MDVYYKKDIAYSFEGHEFVFVVGNTLFSTFDLDHGTDIFVRSIDVKNPKTILDMGCGYGPIGIILANKYPSAKVMMIDRDLLAVRYAAFNAEKNGVKNIKTIGSVGMEKVLDQTFDLIVSNVPAKIGDEAIEEEFIVAPLKQLGKNGELWIVVVNALNRLVPKVCRAHDFFCKEIRKRNGHTVYKIKNNEIAASLRSSQ